MHQDEKGTIKCDLGIHVVILHTTHLDLDEEKAEEKVGLSFHVDNEHGKEDERGHDDGHTIDCEIGNGFTKTRKGDGLVGCAVGAVGLLKQ